MCATFGGRLSEPRTSQNTRIPNNNVFLSLHASFLPDKDYYKIFPLRILSDFFIRSPEVRL